MSSIENKVCSKILDRAEVGKKKVWHNYGQKRLDRVGMAKACTGRGNGFSSLFREVNTT